MRLGYNKGCKYDNGYGRLRAYNNNFDIETVEELAVSLGENPNYLWDDDKMLQGENTMMPVDPMLVSAKEPREDYN